MYILIAGGGIVGQTILKGLMKKHDVVVVEKDYDLCEKIAAKYAVDVIQGDATNINILKEAGIEKCDYALAVMEKDSLNLLFSLLAKNFGIEHIYTRMRDPEYREAYQLAGATNIAHPVQMIAHKFILDIENPEIRRVASLSNGKAEVSIISLKKKTKAIGKTVQQLVKIKDFPKEIVIGGLFDVKKDELIIPRGDTVVQENMQIFLVGSNESIRAAYNVLMK